MKTVLKPILASTMIVTFLLCSVGCKSNGSGPWYHPKTYTLYNPFAGRDKGSEAPPYVVQERDIQKPHLNHTPSISVPPGGYADNTSKPVLPTPPVLQTQYDSTVAPERNSFVAYNTGMPVQPGNAGAAQYGPYESHGYNP